MPSLYDSMYLLCIRQSHHLITFDCRSRSLPFTTLYMYLQDTHDKVTGMEKQLSYSADCYHMQIECNRNEIIIHSFQLIRSKSHWTSGSGEFLSTSPLELKKNERTKKKSTREGNSLRIFQVSDCLYFYLFIRLLVYLFISLSLFSLFYFSFISQLRIKF